MTFRLARVFAFAGIALLAGRTAAAQPAAEPSVAITAGVFNFDLSGTGTTGAIAGRAAVPVSRALAVEGHLLMAWPDQQFGDSTVTAIDGQLQYHWRAGRVRPFVGGGLGVFLNRGEGFSDTDVSLSVAGGARVHLSGRVSAIGEFRLRGVEWDFVGSTAEVMGGVSFRIGGQ